MTHVSAYHAVEVDSRKVKEQQNSMTSLAVVEGR